MIGRGLWVGCKPPDGAPGGDCKDNGCNLYCDNGPCNMETERCEPGGDTPPLEGFCKVLPDVCAADEQGWTCTDGVVPDEKAKDDCRQTDDAGTWCCRYSCALVDASLCGAPTTTYSCTADKTPLDAGGCVVVLDNGSLDFQSCCVEGDTCFTLPNRSWECDAGAVATYCGGNAPVPNEGCTTLRGNSLSGLRAFCCPSPDAGVDDPGIADAGRD